MVARLHNMTGLKKMLERDLDGRNGVRSKDKDRVSVITGYEGTGKSNLMLWMFTIWNELLGNQIDESYITYIGDNRITFIKGLNSVPRYGMVAHDEAGKDLYSRKSMSSFNTDLNMAYMVIRGSNLHTILIIPNLLDLDTFFRKRRVKCLYHVFDTGVYAYFSRVRLNNLLPKLQYASKYSDNPDIMSLAQGKASPNFIDDFPKYKGVLLNPYLERKNRNIEGTKRELLEKYVVHEVMENKSPIYQQKAAEVKVMQKMGLSHQKIAEQLGVAKRTVQLSIQFNNKMEGLANG